MIKRRLIPILFLAAAIACVRFESRAETYTIDKAIKVALENNPKTKISVMEIQKAEAAVDEAFGYAYPRLDVSGNFSHFLQTPKMPFPDFETMLSNATYGIMYEELADDAFKGAKDYPFPNPSMVLQSFALKNNFETSAQLSQIIFNSAVFRGIGASEIYLQTSRESLKSNVANTVFDVRKAFYGVILTKSSLQILRDSYDNAQKNLENVRALHNQGLVAEFDLLQAEVQVENIKPQIVQLENALDNAKNGLKIAMGIDQTQAVEVDGKLQYEDEPIPATDEAIAKARENNFDLKTLQMKEKVDEAFIDLDRAEYWPQASLFANYSYAGAGDQFDEFQTYSSAIVGVQFSMNLFQGNQTKKKVEQGQIVKRQTGEQIVQLGQALDLQIQMQILEIQRVKSQIEAMDRNIKLAERAYSLAESRYKEGIGTQLEIKNADIELQTAKNNRLTAVYDYIIAKFKLENLLGEIDESYYNQYLNDNK